MILKNTLRSVFAFKCEVRKNVFCILASFDVSFHHSSGFGSTLIGLLQLAITWYKIRHAGGQAHYYSRTGKLKRRDLN